MRGARMPDRTLTPERRPRLFLVAAWMMAALWLAMLTPAGAQTLPDWQDPQINDFAGLLTPEDARALDEALTALRDQTGVEGTVVTLPDRARYGGTDGLEARTTRLFNHWCVGDATRYGGAQRLQALPTRLWHHGGRGAATRSDGCMVLVLSEHREARLELGRGYEIGADILAQEIMRHTLRPGFRDGQMSRGIREGTL